MDAFELVAVVFRWIHVGTAIVLVGGTAFMRFVLMPAAEKIPPEAHDALRANLLKTWKVFVHAGIALLLVSGLYNFLVVAMRDHPRDGLYHGLMAVKILLALAIFFLASVLVGQTPTFDRLRQDRKKWLVVVLVLATLIVAISGYLKVRGVPQDTDASGRTSAATTLSAVADRTQA